MAPGLSQEATYTYYKWFIKYTVRYRRLILSSHNGSCRTLVFVQEPEHVHNYFASFSAKIAACADIVRAFIVLGCTGALEI